MDFQNCIELNQSEFERKIRTFKKRCELLFFLLNTLLNITNFSNQLCYCEDRKECLICKIKRTHNDLEYHIYKNMFVFGFLITCHFDLYPYLNQLFKRKKTLRLFYFKQ